MKKIAEKSEGVFIAKEYELEKNANILEIIKEFLGSSIQIKYIKIFEGVERDMQTISGAEYNVQDFIKEYDYIMSVGEDIIFSINASYNNMDFYVLINEKSNIITMKSDSKNVELDDIIGQKKNNGLTNGLS